MPEDKVQKLSYVVAACLGFFIVLFVVFVLFVFHILLLLIAACLLVRTLQNSSEYNIFITVVRLPFSYSFYGFMTEKCLE